MRKIAQHFQDWLVLRGLNITKIARLGSVGEDVQESAGVGPQLCLTDQVSPQIERRKLLLEPFLEDVFMRWSEVAPRAWRLGGTLQLTVPAPAVLTALRLTGLDAYFEIVAPGVPPVKTVIPNGLAASALATQ